MKKILSAICLCLVVSGFSPLMAAEVSVSGKVAVGEAGVPNIQVKAYPLNVQSLAGDAPITSLPSDDAGRFELKLEAGQYYFIAEGKDLFSYYGRNPVDVPREGIEGVNLSLVKSRPPLPKIVSEITEGFAGYVYSGGSPLSGVTVSIYTDLNTQLKGMGLGMPIPSDELGYFEVQLQPGTYYLVARKRDSGQAMGPLRAGDYFGYYADNPLVVKPGTLTHIGIDMVEVPQKVSRLAENMFGKTSIHGRVLNIVGSPVAGVRVLLYTDSSMLNRPLFVSQPSAADGSYMLSFPKGGTYFLAARDKLGGAPGPGELYGRYSDSQDSSVRIRTGQMLEGIDMLVQEMW